MNKYLVLFLEDELTNNPYYKTIREVSNNKKFEFKKTIEEITASYGKHVLYFSPYDYLETLEDFIRYLVSMEPKIIDYCNNFDELIQLAWERGYYDKD